MPAILLAALPEFRCSNCSSTSTDPLALASFIVAIGALVIAGVALAWSHSEHKEFMRRLKARARLRINLEPRDAPQAVDSDDPMAIMAPVGESWEQVIQVTVANDGDTAAGTTVVNVHVEGANRAVSWCDPTGHDLPSSMTVKALDAEVAFTRDGSPSWARWMSQELARVSTGSNVIVFFKFGVRATENRIRLRVSAHCDEQPDDAPAVVVYSTLWIHDRRPPYELRAAPPLGKAKTPAVPPAVPPAMGAP